MHYSAHTRGGRGGKKGEEGGGGVFAVYAIALPGAERRNGERGSLLSPLRISPGALIPWQKKRICQTAWHKNGKYIVSFSFSIDGESKFGLLFLFLTLDTFP